jgi:small-conductance mechanosensitive channel
MSIVERHHSHNSISESGFNLWKHFLKDIRRKMHSTSKATTESVSRTAVRTSWSLAWTLIPLLAVATAMSACRSPDEDLDASSDVDSVAVVDSALASVTPPDSALSAQVADTAVTTPALLDSLLWQVAQLEGMLAQMRHTERRRPTAEQDQNRREQIQEDVSNFGLRAFWAIVVFSIAFFLIKFISWVLETLSERSAKRRLFFKKLIPITRILVWIIVVYYVVAGVFEVDREGLLAAGAAVGVAVGFAAQDVLKNIFGGILIIMDQPFQVGDRVSVGGTYGEVVSIGLRSTRIVTPDDNLVSVPNTQVVDGQVANANAGALDCQVVTTLYLPGWVDVSRAKEIAYDAAANSKFVFLKKPIVVLVKDDFKETFLTRIVVKAYVLDARYEAAFASDVTETAKSQYLREGMLVDFIPGSYRPVENPDDDEVTA